MEALAPRPQGTIPEITLPIRLRLAREAAGFHQDELADLIGISRRTVVNYEMAKHPPRRPVLLSWALATGVDIDWLLGGVGTEGDCPTCGLPADHDELDEALKNRCSCESAQVSGPECDHVADVLPFPLDTSERD